MRKLTFSGFTKRYVQWLSFGRTTSIYRLVKEVLDGNWRLLEPLLLYAISNDRTKTLLTATKDTSLYEQYFAITSKYSYSDIIDALKVQDSYLTAEYHKVWASYISVTDGKFEREDNVKSLIRTKVERMKGEKHLSTYHVCKALGLNNSNVNAWLKNGINNKISIDTARQILAFVDGA